MHHWFFGSNDAPSEGHSGNREDAVNQESTCAHTDSPKESSEHIMSKLIS